MEIFKDLFPLEDRWGKDGVFTPTNIVKDMIDLLPDSIWNPESTFIDISCKTGAFLVEIYTRLDTELSKLDEYKDPVKRRSHILNNQLFGLALRNDESLFFSRRNVFGDPFSDNIDVINAGNSSYLDLVKQKQYSIIETQLKGKFGRMKFDVVVGNPPYNNDIYLDFVTLGHKLSTQYTLMITPAKWQAKGGKKNEDFRANIVPYMKNIIYYPCAQDIFDIRNLDGISYYLIDQKSVHANKIIVNKSINNKIINSIQDREIGKQLNNNGFLLSMKIKDSFKFKPAALDWCPFGVRQSAHSLSGGVTIYKDDSNCDLIVISGDRVQGFCKKKDIKKNTDLIDKYKLIQNAMNGNSYYDQNGRSLGFNRTYILDKQYIQCEPYIVLWAQDNKQEIVSVDSFLWTKTIRFILITSIVGQGLADIEMWRFVPNPNDWSVTYVDSPHPGVTPDEKGYYTYNGEKYCSLYVRYKLSKEDINIIESIIKPRK